MRSSDVTTFTDARDHLREKFDQAKETGRPVMVTNHGRVDGYILSPERYDRLTEAEELLANLAMIDKSREDILAGRTRPMREAIKNIAREIGIQLDR